MIVLVCYSTKIWGEEEVGGASATVNVWECTQNVFQLINSESTWTPEKRTYKGDLLCGSLGFAIVQTLGWNSLPMVGKVTSFVNG
jgi:hypothetical protein